MIGLRMSDRVGGHVGQDEVRRPAERLAQPIRSALVHEVELEDGDALRADQWEEIDARRRRLGTFLRTT
jgi:hypothetical protein